MLAAARAGAETAQMDPVCEWMLITRQGPAGVIVRCISRMELEDIERYPTAALFH